MSTFHCLVGHNDPSALKKMIQASAYWQPDELSEYECSYRPAVSLAFQRFVNTPQAQFEQIHQSHDQRIVCVMNGRLDNRAELGAHMALKVNEQVADGQLLLNAYERWGPAVAERLLGDFVFLIIDNQQRKLFLGRDHMGIKNILYARTPQGLVVSNEHNALLAAGLVEPKLSSDYLVDLALRPAGGRYQSPVQSIHSCPPAHMLEFQLDDLSVPPQEHCYWSLEVCAYPHLRTEADWLEALKEHFYQAVQRRLVSHGRVGCELSEGLDSTGIAAVAAKTLPHETIPTFSYDCIALTQDNAHQLAATYREITDFVAMYPNLEPQWLSPKEEPPRHEALEQVFGAPAPGCGQPLGQFSLLNKRLGVTTLLSGWGGDHCVSSYGSFIEDELFRAGDWRGVLKHVRGRQLRGDRRTLGKILLKLALKYCCPPLFRELQVRRRSVAWLLYQRVQYHPLKPKWVGRDRQQKARHQAKYYLTKSVRERDYRELFDIGIEHRIYGSELYGRLYGVDYRFPMLDKELLELAYSAPSLLKCKNGEERYMYREVLRGLVTERIRTRVKSDVNLPPGEDGEADEATLHDARLNTYFARQHEPLFVRYFDHQRVTRLQKKDPLLGSYYWDAYFKLADYVAAGKLKI